ncbi:MAG: 50S ribosome-binding GTPase [Candidatus ainarchaeum sp.]|nr:50S ribosome-binding GTPase [Candidatus ainarchaeum sp.]
MRLNFLQKPQELLDNAFSRARKEAPGEKAHNEREQVRFERARRISQMENAAEILSEKLEKAVKDFPSVDNLLPFQKELLEATIEIEKTKKALAQFSITAKIIRKIQKEEIKKIRMFGKREKKILEITRSFFGRISSTAKRLDKSIEQYNETARRMNELPNIKAEAPTAILAGFPNTGKTTILARLTGSKAKIASYPFTTQKLQIGYFEAKYQDIQIIDTPGLLDRPFEERNPIERKAIAAIRHLAKIIIFVIDPTEQCGYKLEEQAGLMEETKKQFGVYIITVLNKADLASEEQIEKAKNLAEKIADEILIEGENIDSGLKQKIIEKIFEKKKLA